MNAMPRNYREDELSNVFFETGRVREAFKAIDRLVSHGWKKNYCHAQAILGVPGTGKTHLITKYLETHGNLRVKLVEVNGAKLPGFVSGMLAGLGDPAPDYGTVAARTRRFCSAVEKLELDLLVIEEFQRLIDNTTDRVNKDVGDWVTEQLNRRLCPILLMGEPTALRVFKSNTMLDQRCFPRFHLTLFDWTVEEDRLDFRGILRAVEDALGFPQPSGLWKAETAQRIMTFSKGCLRVAVNLVEEAALCARERNLPCINNDILRLAADKFLSENTEHVCNVFDSDLKAGAAD